MIESHGLELDIVDSIGLHELGSLFSVVLSLDKYSQREVSASLYRQSQAQKMRASVAVKAAEMKSKQAE